MTVASGNMRSVSIFESNNSGVIENMDCHSFRRYDFGSFGNQTKAIIQ